MKLKSSFFLLSIFLSYVSTKVQAENIKAINQTPLSIKAAITDTNKLILASGTFDPKIQKLDFSKTQFSTTDSQKYGIVQFYDKKSNFKWLQASGFQVIQNLTHNAYVVNWQDSDKKKLQLNNDIRWFGAFQSGFKISPNLFIANRKMQSNYQLSIHTFKDVKNFKLKGLIQKYFNHVKVVSSNIPQGFNQYTIEVAANHLDEVVTLLSNNEDIQWLDSYSPQEFFNNEAVSAVQASSSPGVNPIFDQGIFGSGQIVGVADSGLDSNEDWFVHLDKGSGVVTAITDAEGVTPPTLGTVFPNNKVVAYWTMPGALDYDIGTFHGTHVTGSVAGDRLLNIGGGSGGSTSSPLSNGYDNDDGMAPNAQILFQDIGGALNSRNQVSLFPGSKPMWQQAFAAGAAIHSNSYGAASGGDYSGSSLLADETLRELEDMIILFASGNSGPSANTIGTPATAKNVTTIGYLGHGNSTTINNLSSRGPTDDGRLKPDMTATGTSIQSAAGDTNNSNVIESPQITSKSGSSMATPITAGSTALLRQYFMDGFFPSGTKTSADSHTPSGPLMKAMLLNGSNTDVGFFTNNIGWGRVWLENSLYFNGETKRFRFWEVTNDEGLETGEQFSVDVSIQPGEEFRATLVWYDLPGPVGSGITLVNNLNLNVQQGTNTYLANNFTANNSVTGGTADAINTVEQVRISNPIADTYTITVDADNIPGNGAFNSEKQGFALVVSGDLSSGNSIPPNPADPTNLTANSNGLSGIDLSWSDVSADYDNYEIYRTEGSCASADLTNLRYLGSSITNSFTDTTSIGGFQYSYKVRAFSDDLISGYSNCIDATSQQPCLIPPTFNQNSVKVSSNINTLCQISLDWDQASSNCANNNAVKYNIYRSTLHDFTPNSTNLLTTTAVSANEFIDTTILSGQTYFYIVKAEDTSTNGSGPNNGNESLEVYEVATIALGDTTIEGQLIDDVDNLSVMNLSSIWSISNEQSSNGSLSYRSAIEGSNTYTANTCASMYSIPFEISSSPTSPPSISYQARYNIETNWDGVVVEISTDGGMSWVDLPPQGGGYPSNFSSTGNPPGNVCGYAASHGAFNGSTVGFFQTVSHSLVSYQGQTVQIRWNLSTDSGAEEEGFYLDELRYNNIMAPQACLAGAFIFSNGFE
jgi:hypothetical protein